MTSSNSNDSYVGKLVRLKKNYNSKSLHYTLNHYSEEEEDIIFSHLKRAVLCIEDFLIHKREDIPSTPYLSVLCGDKIEFWFPKENFEVIQ